jgi:hypothetical protein
VATETVWLLGASAGERFESIEGAAPTPASRLFAEGGYAIMRDDWSADAGHLIVDCGPHGAMSGAHAHADALSVQLSRGRRPVLVDAGTYTYSDPSTRNYFRGAFAHSVAIIDEVPPSVPAGAFSWLRSANSAIRSWCSDGNFDYLEATHDGYRELDPGLLVDRTILGLKGRYWVLRDRARGGDPHSLQVHFHCAHDLLAAPDGNELRLVHLDGTPLLSISSFSPVEAGSPTYSVEQGWTARCYGDRAPAWHGILHCDRQGWHDVVSFLLPDPETVVRERPAESGRRFEILSSAHHDLLILGAGHPVDDGRIATSADLAWIRQDRRDDRLKEIVLVKATRLAMDGMEVLRDGAVVEQLSAKLFDNVWKVSSPGLSMDRWAMTPTSGRQA